MSLTRPETTSLRLNKSNVNKALNGWLASGGEMSKAQAVEMALAILIGESDLDQKIFRPLGGVFMVNRVTQTIEFRPAGETTTRLFDFAND